MRVRQIVLAAADLDAVEADFAAVFGWRVAYRDPVVGKWGLRNIVVPVGDAFIEVVSPIVPGTAVDRHRARIGGDGGYMVMVQVPDRATQTARLEALGVRAVYHSDQETYCLTQFHPADCGGVIFSWEQVLHPDGADWREPLGYWHAAHGHGWQDRLAAHRVGSMRRVVLGHGPAAALAATWSRLLGRAPTVIDGLPTIAIAGPALAFAEGKASAGNTGGSPIQAVALEPHDPAAVRAAAAERGLLTETGAVRIAGVDFRPD